MTTNRKVILLGLLEETLASAEYSDLSETDIDRITVNHNIAMNFINSLLKTEIEPEVFDSAFNAKMAVSEPREIITDIETLFTDDRSTNYKKSDLTNIILKKSFLDKDLQIEYLPKLLSDDYEKDEEFDDNLNFWIHNTPREHLSTQTLILLENRVNESLQEYTDLQLSDALEQVKFMNNISAMAQLSNSETTSKEKIIVTYAIDNFVLNSSSPLKLVTVIALSDENTTAAFKERKGELIPTLKDSLLDPSQVETDLIQEIIDMLNI